MIALIYKIEKNYNELFISFAEIFEIKYEFKRKKIYANIIFVSDEEIN